MISSRPMSMTFRIFFLIITVLLSLSEGSGTASDRKSLALLPLRLNAPSGMDYLKGAYRDVISARIGSDEGIHVVDQARLQAAMDKYGASDWSEDTKRSLAGETGADYILEGSLSLIGEDLSLDVRLIKVETWNVFPMTYKGKGVGAFTDMLEQVAAGTRVVVLGRETGNIPAAPKDKKEKGWKGQRLPLALKEIEVADFDKDGVNEFAAIDDKNLYIYEFDKDGLRLNKELKGSGQSRNYNMAVGDFNENGTPEIYISRKYMEKAATRVVEFTGNDFTVIADDLPWFVRAVNGRGGMFLAGQKFRQIDGLYGGVKVLKWRNGALEEESALDMPKWIDIYGFTLCDATGDGRDDFIYLDENDRLMLYEKEEDGAWKQMWKSYNYYGGSTNYIESGPASEPKSTVVKAGVVCGRTVEDGRREIIVNSNDANTRIFKNLVSYESGKIMGLLWSETGLEDIWQTKKISGYIADYVTADMNNDGHDEIAALVIIKQSSLFAPGESLIVPLHPQNIPVSK